MSTRPTPRKSRKQDHRTRVGRERSARTETRILRAALGVFGEMGPTAPKIDDFLGAAGISRGTFYNHYASVEELLAAASEWATRQLIAAIEGSLEGIDDPVLRFGVGLRSFLARARSDSGFCKFVAQVWTLGGLDLPERDLRAGLRQGTFRASSLESATDLLYGGLRQSLMRMASGATPPDYGEQVTELYLRALGTPARYLTAVSKYPLPSFEGASG